jgi:hypothetical protein
MKISSSLFCLWLVLLAVHPCLARVATGTLAGIVTDAQGNTLPGAMVEIQTSDGQHPHATHTDANGHFEFTHFEAGQYDLRAYFQGSYSNWVKRVPIHRRKANSITLRIVPANS